MRLLRIKRTRRSIQGNCVDEPSEEKLGLTGPGLDRSPGQCVIASDTTLIWLENSLWLDNLYIRYSASTAFEDDYYNDILECSSPDCNLWLTSVTMQGDGPGDKTAGAIWAKESQVYAEGESYQIHIAATLASYANL